MQSLLRALFAVAGLASLLIGYHIIVFYLEVESLSNLLKALRIVMAFMAKQNELGYAIAVACFSFVVINFIPPKIKNILYPVFIVTVSIWVLYRILNIFHIYYAGSHLGKDFLSHMEKSSFSMVSDFQAVLLFIIVPIPIVLLICFFLKKLNFSSSGLKVKLSLFISICLISYTGIYFMKQDSRTLRMRLWMSEYKFLFPLTIQVPEKYLLSSLRTKTEEKTDNNTAHATIPDRVKANFEAIFGLSIREQDALPLFKPHVFSDRISYSRIRDNAASPNIIIFAMESLSANLIGYYGAPFPEISPYIDKFAHDSLVIKPFYNVTSPTVNSLVSILCSHYPVFGHEDWIDNRGVITFDLLCLPEVLKKRGYHSYNIVPGDPYFAAQLPFMKANGMDEVYGALEIREVLKEGPLGNVFRGRAYSDHQVMRFLIERLKNRSFQAPFLILLSTDDLHPPFRLPVDVTKYRQEENAILHLVHTADAAFGRFWDYYRNSAYSSNTIVLLTADHSMFPGFAYHKLIGSQTEGFYGEVPFIIHDPIHNLPKTIDMNASSVDITPSLLHLLGINIPNSFEGLSVFDPKGRKSHQGLLGSHSYLFFYRVNNSNKYFNRNDIRCAYMQNNHTPSSADEGFTECDYFDWWRYKRWLVQNNRIWRE